jgi:hypothetical protein
MKMEKISYRTRTRVNSDIRAFLSCLVIAENKLRSQGFGRAPSLYEIANVACVKIPKTSTEQYGWRAASLGYATMTKKVIFKKVFDGLTARVEAISVRSTPEGKVLCIKDGGCKYTPDRLQAERIRRRATRVNQYTKTAVGTRPDYRR